MKKSTEISLSLIADRLGNGHASLFVGAGFSKNAGLNPGGKLPPDWSELGDLFFEKLRGRKPRHRDRAYVNVLRLAEEVECSLGREELARIISDAIVDGNLYPSELFYKVLSLPWRDVYTTNYDTLLERTSEYLAKRNVCSYSLVLNQQDLGNVDSPVLMKLHGDINDSSSIVITEEDYRAYAKTHEAMINHIRHTIMMNTLVLVGVSGNDPNFIQWLGWVKDVLSVNQRKIYLLTVDNVPASLKKTYEKKNIIIVDLRNLAGKGASPYNNISFAMDYISGLINGRNQAGKQFKNFALSWGRGYSSGEEGILDTCRRWKKEYDMYPGWLVLPRDKREYWINTDKFRLPADKLREIKGKDDILYLNLFNWRLEISLLPMLNDWEEVYLSVLAKYNPYRCGKEVRQAWINLNLSLMRLYRQEAWAQKWQDLKGELYDKYELLSSRQKCRFAYEMALMAVYRNDYAGLEKILEDWPIQDDDPYWEVRRGALWAEYLSLEKGREITAKAFDVISGKLEVSDNGKERFYWASRKVHAHSILNCMAQANFSSDMQESEYARITWNELRPYDDFWYERQYFDGQLRSYEDVMSVRTKKPSFILGSSSFTTNMDGNSKDYRLAYSYFLYFEELGFPIHLPHLNTVEKSTLAKALSIMSIASPVMAESFLMRSGNAKLVEYVFNRCFLHKTRVEEVSRLYDKYVNLLTSVLDNDNGDNLPSWVLALRGVLPGILSRLCMKSSYESRVSTFDQVDRIYRDKECLHYDGVDKLVHSLMLSFSAEQVRGLIPKLVVMAVAKSRFDDCRYDPFCYMEHQFDTLPSVDPSVIDNLFNQLGVNKNTDSQIYYRLIFLDKCGALDLSRRKLLAKAMWSRRDAFGFPESTGFHRFAFISFPHPDDVDPVDLFGKYIGNNELPKIGNASSVSIYGGNVPILTDILGTSNSGIPFLWNAGLLNHVCEEIVLMWESDKSRLLNDKVTFGISIKEEVLMRFRSVEKIITWVLVPNIRYLTPENAENLYRTAKDFEQYGVPSFRSVVMLSDILDKWIDVGREIMKRMGASDKNVVLDCIGALIQMYKQGKDVLKWVIMISEYFRSNSGIGQSAIIDAMDYFTNKEEFLHNESLLTNLMVGLQRLYFCTEILDEDNEQTVNDKMNLRMLVAPIVKKMVNLGKELPMNDILASWTSYYDSDETCLDIRNRYIN